MSDLTVRTPGGQWLNICDSEWYVRNDDNNGWSRIDPLNDVRVRHGSNEYWIPVTCDGDNELCPPESIIECWPGYNGNFDSGEFKTGGNTGYLVCSCDGTECKTYTGHTPTFDVIGGRFFSTAPVFEGAQAPALPTTFFGAEAQVNEMLVKAGNRSGNIDVSVHSLDPGVRVRVYHNCNLLGDSNISGYYFNVFFNAEPPELREEDCGVQREVNNFITVRVDAPSDARWRVRLGAVNTVVSTSYQRPAPCFGTFAPNLPCFVNDDDRVIPGAARYEMIHQIPASGVMHIDTNIRGEDPVTLSVFYNGGMIATTTTTNTPENPSALATLAFNLDMVGGDSFIVVRYEAPREYNDWTYSIYCPNQRGSRNDMMPCTPVPAVIPYDVLCTPLLDSLPPEWTVAGKGAPYTDVYYDFSGKRAGDIVVEFFAEDSVQIFFYQGKYPNEVLVGATEGFVRGHDRFYFDFDPSFGTVLHARIVGPCCPNWAFMLSCPVPKPVINIYDAEITRGKGGKTDLLCFNVELENKTPRDVTFDWAASPLTAMESTDGTCTITELVKDSPFCNIIATGSAKNAYAENDVWVGYGAARLCSTLHDANCAAGGAYYVIETEIELPITGTYIIVGAADDNMSVYLDCRRIFRAYTWEWAQSATFTAEAGWQTLSAMYQNVPGCTPSWVKFAILRADTRQVVFASNASKYFWRSKAGGITVEPPPRPITYGADYNKSAGKGVIPACTKSMQVCVPVCGTDLMGPDVTLQVLLSNIKNAVIGDLAAIGTIKNPNYYECDQETQIAVLDGGADQYINRGARKMYLNKLAGNSGAAYVMDAEITLNRSGLHTIYLFGLDVVELYVDCRMVARLTNPSYATKIRLPMNMGKRKVHINYYTNATAGRRTGYAALAIVDNLNRVVYASKASDWRGRIINVGTEPYCNQFPGSTPYAGLGETYQGRYGYWTIHRGGSIYGTGLNYAWWSAEKEFVIPEAGDYYAVGSADDAMGLYIGCQGRPLNGTRFYLEAGPTLFHIRCYNYKAKDENWCHFRLYKANGTLVYVSRAAGWKSKARDLDFTGFS